MSNENIPHLGQINPPDLLQPTNHVTYQNASDPRFLIGRLSSHTMSALPTNMDILGWRLAWLAVQFGIEVEECTKKGVEVEEEKVKEGEVEEGEVKEGEDFINLEARIEELRTWLGESTAEWKIAEMGMLLEAEEEEEKTAEELADEFLERLAEELEDRSNATVISEIDRPISPISEEGDVLERGLTIPGLRLWNQGVQRGGVGVESCERKRQVEDVGGRGEAGGKRRRMGW